MRLEGITDSHSEQIILTELTSGGEALRAISSEIKAKVLRTLANNLNRMSPSILASNQIDLEKLPEETPVAFRDRLRLDDRRIQAMAESLNAVAELPDPVGEIAEKKVLANGLKVSRVRAPLGNLFMIFESRPNVILEAFSLAFKSGNTIILRGGSESSETARAIYKIIEETLKQCGILFRAFAPVLNYDRQIVLSLLKRNDCIDVVIPRGGEKLIAFVQREANMPIIKNDRGLCHTYVAASADLDMALNIVINAKVQRPGVCNSLETVLVDKTIAHLFLPKLHARTLASSLQWYLCDQSFEILKDCDNVSKATAQSWDTEYLDLKINCKVVESLNEALAHIAKHGSKHSEAIVTNDEAEARKFQSSVDAAAAYWNASTRFTDGFELGLGGELGISTQKLHVRGPVGLREMTSLRWVIDGTGQTRK